MGTGRAQLAAVALTVGVLAIGAGACGTADHSLRSGDTAPGGGSTTATAGGPDALLLTCDAGSTVFPPSALANPVGAEQGSDPAAVALGAALTQASVPDQRLAQYQDWRKVVQTDDRAGFLATAGPASGAATMYVELALDHGRWKYYSSGGCEPEVYRHGMTTAQWALDPIYPPPVAADTQIHVIVNDPECNDGVRLDPKRVHPATVDITQSAVSITYFVDPVSPGLHTCPGPIGAPGRPDIMGVPLVVELGQALGSRQVLNATNYPPKPAVASSDP